MSEARPLGPLAPLLLRLGFGGFGGPLADIAIMETEVVERRSWLSRQKFLDGLACARWCRGPLRPR
jgi:chromate transporter